MSSPAPVAIATQIRSELQRNSVSITGVLLTLLSVLLFLLLNPFLALFILALIALGKRIPVWSFIIPATIAFTLFFYAREYGIEWYTGSSTDDVPTYVAMYNSNFGLSFPNLLIRFLLLPSGNEILWHIPWWMLTNWFDASDNTFIFLHYLVMFLSLFLALGTLSGRYLIPFVLVYFFLTPTSIDGVAHIWRQQLASFIFLAGIGLYVVRGQSFGKWLIYLSALVHLSNLFLIAGFLVFELLRKRRAFEHRLKFLVVMVIVLAIVPVASTIAVHFLETILPRILQYFEGTASPSRVYFLIGAYCVPQLAAFLLLRNDDLNRLFLLLCCAVFSIVLALPAANGIYDRLLMFILPLWGLYIFRCVLRNFGPAWRLPFLVIAFAVGTARLYAPVADSSGPGFYLAFGHAFEPTMGALRLLTSRDQVE